MSRCAQLISSVQVFDNIVTVFPQDAQFLCENLNEHALRPLTSLEPELQTATWELIRALRKKPDASIIAQVVGSIQEAIDTGWRERCTKELQGTVSQQPQRTATSQARRTLARQSGELGNLCRWAARISTWDAEAIALVDDETRLRCHLKAARKLKTFCEVFIEVIEGRLRDAH